MILVGLVMAAAVADSAAPTAGSSLITAAEVREVAGGWSAKKQILGFLGIGERDVAVPVSKFKQEQGRIVLPGASKDALKAAPKFEYANK